MSDYAAIPTLIDRRIRNTKWWNWPWRRRQTDLLLRANRCMDDLVREHNATRRELAAEQVRSAALERVLASALEAERLERGGFGFDRLTDLRRDCRDVVNLLHALHLIAVGMGGDDHAAVKAVADQAWTTAESALSGVGDLIDLHKRSQGGEHVG